MPNGTTEAGGGGLSDLLKNKLLLQYLSAGGLDITQTGTLGSNVNKVTQENISAQNYAGLLRSLLSSGGKVSMDRDNVSIKAPQNAFTEKAGQAYLAANNPGGGLPSLGPPAQTAPQSLGEQNDVLGMLLRGENPSANPSGSPLGDLSPSDLAGLTPQDISQALQFKLAQDEAGQQRINNLVDNIYKTSLIEQGEESTQLAKVKEMRQWEELLRTAPLEVPGIGKLSLDVWDGLPTDVKAYSYYAFTATQSGEDVLSYNEFKQQADPASLAQYYNLAKEDPEFKKFYFESKAAGATQINIGQQVEKKIALAEAEGQTYFSNPKWIDDLNRHLDSDAVKNKLFEADENEQQVALEEKIKWIESKVEAGGGKIVEASIDEDGKTGIWTIKWPSGNTRKIRYGLYD